MISMESSADGIRVMWHEIPILAFLQPACSLITYAPGYLLVAHYVRKEFCTLMNVVPSKDVFSFL